MGKSVVVSSVFILKSSSRALRFSPAGRGIWHLFSRWKSLYTQRPDGAGRSFPPQTPRPKVYSVQLRRLSSASTAVLAVLAVTLSPSVGAWSANKYKVLHAFGKGNDGGGLWTSVTLDKKGSLYGATSGGGSYSYGTIFRLTPHADSSWTETILHSFKNGDPNGSEPNGGLVHDLAGNWYGTTNRDGAHHGGTALELRHGPAWLEGKCHLRLWRAKQ
jgi:uncharacterized repeat protein (TIGR03803 family)